MLALVFTLLFATAPAWAQSEPVGTYDNGSLENANCLPATGEGYMQLYRDLNHIWGTMPLIKTVTCAAESMAERFPGRDRMQVEDMSARNGGDVEGHGSHENGLDVDIQYFKADNREHVPSASQYYAEPMVAAGKVIANFDVARNWEFVKALHRCGDVGRIFMDQVLKNRLCAHARATGDYQANIQVLRTIRHVTNHQDHLHMRLNCPKSARRCRNQPPPPPGSGCP